MKLKPGCEVEYEKRHRAIWPELVKLLKETGVSEYSIFWDKETNLLFAVQEQAGDSGSQDLGTNPVVKKWWDYMADIMDVNPDNSPVSIPLKEVFYMKEGIFRFRPVDRMQRRAADGPPSVFRVFGLVVRRCSEIFPKYAIFGSKCLSLG